MKREQAENLMFFLWYQGYLDKDLTEDHSEYDYIIELITKGKFTKQFIKDLIYNR